MIRTQCESEIGKGEVQRGEVERGAVRGEIDIDSATRVCVDREAKRGRSVD